MTVWDDPLPGFKWPVSVSQPIPTSSERVWQTISTPGYLEPCHPFCAKNPVEWYVIRDEPVPRNQFGEHPWFSVPRCTKKA